MEQRLLGQIEEKTLNTQTAIFGIILLGIGIARITCGLVRISKNDQGMQKVESVSWNG